MDWICVRNDLLILFKFSHILTLFSNIDYFVSNPFRKAFQFSHSPLTWRRIYSLHINCLDTKEKRPELYPALQSFESMDFLALRCESATTSTNSLIFYAKPGAKHAIFLAYCFLPTKSLSCDRESSFSRPTVVRQCGQTSACWLNLARAHRC